MIAAPLLIFLLTLAAASIVSLFRRQHLIASVIMSAFSMVIALLVLFLPLDEALSFLGISLKFSSDWVILGRSFILNSTNRNAISYLFITGGFFLLGSWTVRPVRMFLSLGLGILFLVASSLMIVPFLFAAIFIQLAVIAGVVMLTSRMPGHNKGGIRLLIFYTFGMFALLLSGWAVDVGGVIDDASILSERALLLLYFGFSVLLAIPPFHSWIPISSEETHPFAVGFMVLILQGAGMFFFMRFMIAFPWLWVDTPNLSVLRIAGATLAVVGALWTLTQDTIAKQASYAMVSDTGVVLIALGFGPNGGFQIALGLLAARVISVACWAIGMATLTSHTSITGAKLAQLPGSGPWISKLLIVVGVISLGGMPLTAGFPARWALMNLGASEGPFLWGSILISVGIIGYSGLRRGYEYLTRKHIVTLSRLGNVERSFLLGGAIVNILMGIFPQILYPWIFQAVEGLSLASP